MNVCVHVSWWVELHDEIDVLNVDSSCGYVSGHKYIECPGTEGCKGGITLFLSNVSVQRLGGKAFEDSARYKFVSFTFGFCENNRLAEDLLLHCITRALALCSSCSSDFVGAEMGFLIFIITFLTSQFFNAFHVLRYFNGNDIFQDRPFGPYTGWNLNCSMPDGLRYSGSTFVTGRINRNRIFLVLSANTLDPWRGRGRK
mmetsp:Transcript_8743/g.21940  ORF Transcript_8743/g.21940 Transcript_8743/m.21940 type:complete len:200 (+) Transcript_8743:1088-1687(+)